jgi:hypothetical protein
LGHAVYPEHLTHARPIKNRAPQNTILSQRKIEISSFSLPNVLDNRYLNFELLSKFFGREPVEISHFSGELGLGMPGKLLVLDNTFEIPE